MAVRTAYAPVAGEVLTAANLAKLPGGWIGYAEVNASQTGVTAQVDATGLSVTVTVGTSRRICIEAWLLYQQVTAAGRGGAYIMEGATQLQNHAQDTIANGFAVLNPKVVLTPTAGTHTYKVQLACAVAGTLTLFASSTVPAFLKVEDIGPAS